MKHGHTKSGGFRTPEYICWAGMKQRCYIKNHTSYPKYGGLGIKVCQRWLDSFESFLNDMGKRPGDGYTVDRIDSDGDYEPSNCRWATRKEQSHNRRNCLMLEFMGVKKSTAAWAGLLGFKPQTIFRRVKAGWPADKALTTPLAVTCPTRNALIAAVQ